MLVKVLIYSILSSDIHYPYLNSDIITRAYVQGRFTADTRENSLSQLCSFIFYTKKYIFGNYIIYNIYSYKEKLTVKLLCPRGFKYGHVEDSRHAYLIKCYQFYYCICIF